MKSAKRPLARFRRNPAFDGYVRHCPDGYEVVDNDGNLVAGPNPDKALVMRWAHDVGVEVPDAVE